MKNFLSVSLLVLVSVLLSSCAEMSSNAPIDDRTGIKTAPKASAKKDAEPTALVADQPGFYTVKKGDTLLRISQQFSQNWRDLVDWNRLANANDIKVGQSLRVVTPEGAQVAAVNLDSGIEVRPLDGAQALPHKNLPSLVGAKTSPAGEKRLYSDQAFAEMQQPQKSEKVQSEKPLQPRVPDNDKKESLINGGIRFIWPTDGKVIKAFEQTRKGIDIAGLSGQPVMAASDGTVLYAQNMRGYGNLIIVDHNEGLVSAYAHNKTILVKEGQNVIKGQRIAEMGDSDSDTVKLHFEIRQLGKPVDPAGLLPNR